MKTDRTELVFILDRSGSMGGLENDTIGGYNALLKKQKEEPGEAFVTTILFDNEYEVLHDRLDIREILPITHHEYYVRGCTALLDAVGKTIHRVGNRQRSLPEDRRADKVLVVITTDGMENASVEYTYSKVRAMIGRQKEKYAWEFIFLGANIDAVSTAEKFGIGADRAADFLADPEGVRLNYRILSDTVSGIRQNRALSSDWKAGIEKDFNARGGRKKSK
ncbi:vWA domain-containing protein [Parasporobacterium paucivorans]|uniref:Uncharacterized conserved protein YegL, contains vWA domain of TerY type n=1 Tax=Parasporobacterium paucivorans DSM 15970 TaxID=1122934 RepID=A0A1M6J1E2_9FIRM|nr:vWA domain-containing protein [Parasporobacterium paucivorans]SHJ40497.1 Uncharacterized conserved protein YegL, contains vWA domain of TerY type [Parasporobacterium paucivorans DSM 15970]